MNVETQAPSQAIGSITLNGSWNDARFCPACSPNISVHLRFSYGYGPAPTTVSSQTAVTVESGIHSLVISPTIKDSLFSYWFSAREYRNDCSCAMGSFINGSQYTQKTYADVPTLNAPSNGTPTQTTCPTIAVTFNPKTVESLAELRLQYKISSASVWTDGPVLSTSESGDFNRSLNTTLTGLTPNTTYNYRFRLERTTENERIAYSPTGTFSTRPIQTTSTAPASSITANGATLNGSCNPNHALNVVTAYFEWGLTTAYGNVTPNLGPFSGTSGSPLVQAITGLLQNTLYHFRAVGKTSEVTTVGGDFTFTTSAGAPTHTKDLTETVTLTEVVDDTPIAVHPSVYFNEGFHKTLYFNESITE